MKMKIWNSCDFLCILGKSEKAFKINPVLTHKFSIFIILFTFA